MRERTEPESAALYALLDGLDSSPAAFSLLETTNERGLWVPPEAEGPEAVLADLPHGQRFPGCIQLIGEIAYGFPLAKTLATIRQSRTVELLISSGGGDTAACLAIYLALRERPTVATVTGRCCSSAVLPLLAADERRICADAYIMVHSPVGFVAGPPAALQREADELQAVIGKVKAIYRTRIAPDLVDKWFDGADYWMDASEAIRCGLCTQIIPAPERPTVDLTSDTTPTAASDPIFESLAQELLERLQRMDADGLQRILRRLSSP
jgi:ATP-dependent protease ClpP protease subunit